MKRLGYEVAQQPAGQEQLGMGVPWPARGRGRQWIR
jgi:hypothetical protein